MCSYDAGGLENCTGAPLSLKEEDCTVHIHLIFSNTNNIFERPARHLSHSFGLRYRLVACNSAIDANGLDLAGFFGIEKILKV
jgi:hypothetical protein